MHLENNLSSALRLALAPDGALTREQSSPVRAPLIIDSWLVVDGSVRALERHESRFRESCRSLLPQIEERLLERFLGEMRRALPRAGRWFPRMEAYAEGQPQLALWLRGAPDPQLQTKLEIPAKPDPRTRPGVKGPDLPALAALREQARAAGADDALLQAPDGSVLETAHSALVWWRGETLCRPAARRSLLPSVTCALLVEIARRRAFEVIEEQLPAAELGGLEAWTLNALHGIRPVAGWLRDGSFQQAMIDGERVANWSAALDELAAPIDDGSPSEARCARC